MTITFISRPEKSHSNLRKKKNHQEYIGHVEIDTIPSTYIMEDMTHKNQDF